MFPSFSFLSFLLLSYFCWAGKFYKCFESTEQKRKLSRKYCQNHWLNFILYIISFSYFSKRHIRMLFIFLVHIFWFRGDLCKQTLYLITPAELNAFPGLSNWFPPKWIRHLRPFACMLSCQVCLFIANLFAHYWVSNRIQYIWRKNSPVPGNSLTQMFKSPIFKNLISTLALFSLEHYIEHTII